MISTITLNPSLDKTIYVNKLVANDTNRVLKEEIDAGGKGVNCSRMLHELGASTQVITFLGGKTGDFIAGVLDREGIPLTRIDIAKSTRTCIAVEESSDVPPTTFNELGGSVEHSNLVALLERAKDASRTSSYMVFGGSLPPGIGPDIYDALIQIAAHGGARAVLDTDGEPLVQGLKARPFMVKPNLAEASRLLDTEFSSKADVARGALKIAEMGVELAVISLGKRGSVAAYEGAIYDVSAPEVKSISTIGSGDSMTAGILWALEEGKSIEDALKYGSATGAATAMSDGTDIGKRADVEQLVERVTVRRLTPEPNQG